MKILTKKSVIFTALAVVFFVTALVINCTPLIDGISNVEEPSKPGTGKVRLAIGTANYRSILPIALPSGYKYLLILEGSASGSPVGDPLDDFYADVPTGNGQKTISNIPEGTYESAKVIVYIGSLNVASSTIVDDIRAAAIGESETITEVSSLPLEITEGDTLALGAFATKLYLPGQAPKETSTQINDVGVGDFTYKITNSATDRIDTAKFTIKKRSDNSVYDTYNNSNVTFLSSPSVTEVKISNMPSTSYNVIYSLTDKLSSLTINFFEILHVYKGCESVYETAFTAGLFPPVAGTGDATLTVTPPGLPSNTSFTGNLAGTNGASVIGSTTGGYTDGWNVTIDKTGSSSSATLTLTLSSPSPIDVTFTDLMRIEPGDVFSILGNGISGSSGATIIITFDTTDLSFVYDVNDEIETQIVVTYGGIDFSIYRLMIKFI